MTIELIAISSTFIDGLRTPLPAENSIFLVNLKHFKLKQIE